MIHKRHQMINLSTIVYHERTLRYTSSGTHTHTSHTSHQSNITLPIQGKWDLEWGWRNLNVHHRISVL